MPTSQALASRQRGAALIAVVIIVAVLTTITASVMGVNLAHQRESHASSARTRALYMADAGVSQSLIELAAARRAGTPPPATAGTEGDPRVLRGGRYHATIAANVDGSFTITSTGAAGTARRTVRAEIAPVDSVFDHAIFAGNRDKDPAYTLGLGGTLVQSDEVDGSIYSGGDIQINGDATVSGDISARGVVSGASGQEGVSRRLPDIAGADYPNNHDYDVAALFSAEQSLQTSVLGGDAYQVPEANPAHIFRKNPDNRATEISSTSKDDFFLEDPYMPLTDFSVPLRGEDGHTITLSGTMGAPGPSGTEKVYYIDGNLWVHNDRVLVLRFLNTDAEGVKVTFVVRGNIYFGDDLYLDDPVNDGLAFIAIADDTEPDSGNIFLGDPRFGTIQHMQAYLYAENDFYDNNLSATGSASVELRGNMTAGRHVSIQRDFVDETGVRMHSKLKVDFDERLSNGTLELPGLPGTIGGVEGLEVVLWREVAVQ